MKAIIKSIIAMSFAIVSYSYAMDYGIQPVKIQKSMIQQSSSIGQLDLYCDAGGFYIIQESKRHILENANVDPLLRKLNPEQLSKFHEKGYLQLKKYSDDSFGLVAHPRLKGGGVLGALTGFWAGKFAVHLAAQGAYAPVSGDVGLICPPMAAPTYLALQLTFSTPVEFASNVVGVSTGLLGGTATGPV